MGSFALKIDGRGRLLLPAALRRQAGLSENQEVIAIVEPGGRVVLEARDGLMDELRATASHARLGSGLEELDAWRTQIDALASDPLPIPAGASPESARRGQALLDELGL